MYEEWRDTSNLLQTHQKFHASISIFFSLTGAVWLQWLQIDRWDIHKKLCVCFVTEPCDSSHNENETRRPLPPPPTNVFASKVCANHHIVI